MTTGRRAACCAVALLCALGRPLAADPAPRDRLLPEPVAQVIGLADGSGLVLGAGATRLLQIRAADAVELVDHPPVGTLFHATTRGAELWGLGASGLLHRRGAGRWEVVRLAPGPLDPDRRPVVVATGDGHALVFAAVLAPDRGAGTTVIEVPAHGPPRPVAWFARYAVRTAVGDGDGTVWALLIERGPDGGSNPATGYLRLREGHWTLFRADGPLALPGVDDQPTTRSSFVTLVTDGRGGAYATAGRLVFHIDPDGAVRELAIPRPTGRRDDSHDPPGLAVDERGDLVAAAASSSSGDPIHVVRLDPDTPGEAADRSTVALPAWYTDAEPGARYRLAPLSLSVVSGVVWIAAGPVVVSNVGGTWTTFVAPSVLTWMDAESRRERRRARGPLLTVGPAVLSVTAGIGAAAYGTAQIHDERVRSTGLQVVAGSTAGLLPWIVATQLMPGDEAVTTPGGAIGHMMYMLGATATPSLTALGTWGAGELTGGSQHRGLALLGAWGGAAAGTFMGLAMTRIARDASPPVRRAVEAFGLAVVGSCATLGYQLAGGGPD